MNFRELIKVVKEDGWFLVHVKGSHHQYEHHRKPGKVTIAGHPAQDVPKGTLNAIFKQAGLDRRR